MNHDEFAERLEKGRERYEAGEKSELLWCLNYCVMNDRPIPDWLKQALGNACDAAHAYKIKSWDEAFGKPLAKGKRLETERRKREIAVPVFERINERHKAGEPREKLFREVGKDFGVGSTVAKELYYELVEEVKNYEQEEEVTATEDDIINRK